MDRFRDEDAALREHVEQRAQDDLQRARWLAFGFVVLFSATVLVARDARAGAAGAARPGARPSSGASTSTRCRAPTTSARPRSCCAGGPSGSRPARTRSCSPATPAATRWRRAPIRRRVPGLADALVDATPRYVSGDPPRGTPRAQSPTRAPLQTCELCHRSGRRLALRPVRGRRRGHRLAARRSRTARSSRSSASGSSWRSRRPPRSSPTCATSRSPSTARRPTR